MNQEIISFLKAALECSVFVAPLEPGLTYDELIEVGKGAGYQQGEIGDALRFVTTQFFGRKRLVPDQSTTASWIFLQREDPDYRNFDAFDFVVAELSALARAEGAAKALLQRNVMVERAVAKGIPRHDIEVAITYQVMANMLAEKDGVLRFPNNHGARGLPSGQLSAGRGHLLPRPHRKRAFPIVKDVIERRTDGRPRHAEPLDAFAEELDRLGYAPFRLWWTRTVAELRQDVTTSPDGKSLWPVSFEFRSQPSSEFLSGVCLALRRVKIFFFATSKSTSKPPLWRESYPPIYDLEANNVILYAFGSNTQRGQIVEAKPGNFIGAVDPPHDFFRISGLDEESIIVAYSIAYSKNIEEVTKDHGVVPSHEVPNDVNYSFVRVRDRKAVELLSIEQERLLKVIAEKERQCAMGPQRPKVGPGWVLLTWVQRRPFLNAAS